MRLKNISFRSIIAILIVMVMIVCSSINCMAVDDTNSKNYDVLSLINELNKPVNSYLEDDLLEIYELRKSNSKAYRLNDSQIKFEIYAKNIHYLDKNGLYQEIDNSIIEVKEEIEATRNIDSQFKYKNNNNSWFAYFGNNEVYIDDGQNTISFEIQNISSKSKLIKSSDNYENSVYDQKILLDDRVVIYKDAFSGVDITYTCTENALKEDIVLRSYTGINKFIYKITSDYLTPVLKDECIVFIDSKGKQVSSLGKLFMYDSNGKRSENLQYTLDEIKGDYYLTITADKSFLQSSSTIYPVVIDPTYEFQWQVSNGTTYDTFVSQKYPNANYGTSQFLAVSGASSYTYGNTRTYVRFSNVDSVVPYDFPISSATLWLRKKNSSGTGSFKPRIYASESSWYESSLCYNNDDISRWSMQKDLNYVESQYAIMFDISEIAQRWNHTGYVRNWGFELNNVNSNHWIEFYSCEYSPKTDGPKLEIVAEDTTGYANKSLDCQKSNCSATYYDALCNSTYTSDLLNAINSWNRTNLRSETGINITRTTTVDDFWKVMVDNSLESDVYGENSISYIPETGEIVKSVIRINAAHPDMNDDTVYRNGLFRQSVFAHELGHTFGLDDRDEKILDPIIPGNNKWSIMSYAADSTVVVVPSRIDINNVIANYN